MTTPKVTEEFKPIPSPPNMKATPFVKWAGGKRQILKGYLLPRLPKVIDTYYEPFVGGGAVLFALANRGAYKKAVINDMNKELITAYAALATGRVQAVIDLLKTYPNEEDFYYEMRSKRFECLSVEEQAARFIYLNHTCFNGLYRVSKKSGFNSPYGFYVEPKTCNEKNLKSVADALQFVDIDCQDFEPAVQNAKQGDFVYFDPPYIPQSETSNFTAYTMEGFGPADHERLALTFRELADRGVSVLLSNSDLKLSRKLYEGFRIESVKARRNINSNGKGRGKVGEILVSANLLLPMDQAT